MERFYVNYVKGEIKMELKTINGKDLIPSEWNPRSEFDEEKLLLLKKSMAGIGLVEPLVVRPYPNRKGKYLITAGERRWKSNPETDFICIIRNENDLRAKVSCLVENYVRENIADVDHEKFISGIYTEGIKQKEWKTELDMETKTGIPQQLISNNVLAHKDRLSLSVRNFVNVSTWDILDTRTLSEKPKVRKKLLEKRNNHKIKGAGRVLQKWSNALNELPEDKGLEVISLEKVDLEDVEIAVEIYKGIREPGMFNKLEKISRLQHIVNLYNDTIEITPSYVKSIKNEKDRKEAINFLKETYNHLYRLLVELGIIEVVNINEKKPLETKKS